MKKRMRGSIHHAALSGGRLLLFPNAEINERFRADPAKYLNADLGLEGQCAVCRVEMNQAVQGKPELSLIYGGLRYQFPGEKQLQIFLADPTKYAGVARGNQTGTTPGRSDTK